MERTDLILLALSDIERPIVGTTRLQKLIFLIEKESNVKIEGEDFGFRAHLFGPASDKIYDDINFLENLRYIEKAGNEIIDKEWDINNIESFDADVFLSGEVSGSMGNATLPIDSDYSDENEDDLRIYKITDKGLAYLHKKGLDSSLEGKSIKQIVKRYSKNSLLGLLQYVYSKYEDYTSNSIIKDKI